MVTLEQIESIIKELRKANFRPRMGYVNGRLQFWNKAYWMVKRLKALKTNNTGNNE
jgi:hypothetical protein